MKTGLVITAGILVALTGLGMWLGVRRQPAGSLLDEPYSSFTCEAAPPGWRVGLRDATLPLRAMKWLPPRQPGVLLVQVRTQSDRQEVGVFREGAAVEEFNVVRPQGVGEGFWRSAVLQDGFRAPEGTLVLLFESNDPASSEPSLAMALDPGTAEARWVHRGPYQRMAVGGAGDQMAVFLFGPVGPVQRLPLAGTVRRPVAKDIALPPEVPEVEDLLPTGAWTFLASTRKGLSAYLGAKGWTHYPAPEAPFVPCAPWRSSLAHSGKRTWWQPAPGHLVQVGPDGALVSDREVTGLADDPQALDAGLLRLLGADAAGCLWFDLASPATPVPLPTSVPPSVPASVPATAPATASSSPPAQAASPDPATTGAARTVATATPADWTAYAALGLDRVYRWNPDTERLERFAWSQAWAGLTPPPGISAGVRLVHPEAATLLVEGGRAGWWLPLGSLPFKALTQSGRTN